MSKTKVSKHKIMFLHNSLRTAKNCKKIFNKTEKFAKIQCSLIFTKYSGIIYLIFRNIARKSNKETSHPDTVVVIYI